MINEMYFSVDVETDGPIPGPNSMLSLGCAAFRAGSEDPVATFSANILPLPGAAADPDTNAWWARPEQAAALAALSVDPVTPELAMPAFASWVATTAGGCKPVCVAYPSGFDFMFCYWYLIRFAQRSPFSFGALDIRSAAMIVMGTTYSEARKANFPIHWTHRDFPHTHVALDDAIEQGTMFMRLLADARELRGHPPSPVRRRAP